MKILQIITPNISTLGHRPGVKSCVRSKFLSSDDIVSSHKVICWSLTAPSGTGRKFQRKKGTGPEAVTTCLFNAHLVMKRQSRGRWRHYPWQHLSLPMVRNIEERAVGSDRRIITDYPQPKNVDERKLTKELDNKCHWRAAETYYPVLSVLHSSWLFMHMAHLSTRWIWLIRSGYTIGSVCRTVWAVLRAIGIEVEFTWIAEIRSNRLLAFAPISSGLATTWKREGGENDGKPGEKLRMAVSLFGVPVNGIGRTRNYFTGNFTGNIKTRFWNVKENLRKIIYITTKKEKYQTTWYEIILKPPPNYHVHRFIKSWSCWIYPFPKTGSGNSRIFTKSIRMERKRKIQMYRSNVILIGARFWVISKWLHNSFPGVSVSPFPSGRPEVQ